MTNRVQTQHSSSTGVRPTGRKPGELYVNLADMQYGVIDPTGTPKDLGAIRLFSANANYAIGDFAVQAGVLYCAKVAVPASAFDSTEWTIIGGVGHDIGSGYLPLAGGTLTGNLLGTTAIFSGALVAGSATVGQAPVAALDVATKQYVDGTTQAIVQAGAGLTIDCSLGRDVNLSLTANITSVSIINWPTTAGPARLRLVIQNTGSFTIAGWPTGTVGRATLCLPSHRTVPTLSNCTLTMLAGRSMVQLGNLMQRHCRPLMVRGRLVPPLALPQ